MAVPQKLCGDPDLCTSTPKCASAMVHDCQLWRPVCQGREVMTPCISPLWTKSGVPQKLPVNGLHISPATLRASDAYRTFQ